LVLLFRSAVCGADWPTYQHDNARSGVTSGRLEPPLSPVWVFESPHPPARGWGDPEEGEVWSYGVTRVGRVRYDDSYHVAAVGDAVYFASSAENKVYSLDAATGKMRWVFYTDAAPRLAPSVWRDKVYVGSDDGFVYCLDAASGEVVWKFRAAPGEDRVLGQGRLMSLWPVRTSVLVDNGLAYFGAGLFPAEGLCLYAVRAADGKLVWVNDAFDKGGGGSLSPQGYLLASKSKLFVPSGRISPGVFSREDGRLLFEIESGWGLIGGTYAMLTKDYLYNGTQLVMAHHVRKTVKDRYGREIRGARAFSWYKGRRIVIDKGIAYILTDSEMLAIPNESVPRASKEVHKLCEAFWKNRHVVSAYRRAQAELGKLDKGNPRRARFMAEVRRLKPKYDAYLAEERKVNEYLDRTCKWRLACRAPDSLILAGGVLFTGGDGQVVAVDAATGRKLWRGEVSGKARGLAVANARLFVSTTTGNIHCFAPKASVPAGGPKRVGPPRKAEPYPNDKLTRFYAQTAENIIRESGLARGYCLILGGGTGRLAFELARGSELNIYVVEPDARKVAQARNALSLAGLYGARVCVERRSLPSLPYPPYFANLIICEEGSPGGDLSTPAKELLRLLRPLGGVAYVGQPPKGERLGRPLSPGNLRRWLMGLEGSNATIRVSGAWAKIARGRLKGATDWTHQYADAGNTGSSDDQLARAPFGVLWFGDPGPRKMIDRHARGPAPLVVNGRLFIMGRRGVIAYDAYNGLPLWERDLPRSSRESMPLESSSMAASEDSLFVAVNDKCLRLDAATGETRQTYSIPPRADGKRRRWGWIATAGALLFGSRTESDRPFRGWPEPKHNTSECVFATDIATGNVRWAYNGKGIMHVSLAVGDGKVFFLDPTVTEKERKLAIRERIKDPDEQEKPLLDRKGKAIERDVRLVVALDAATGARSWTKPLDVTDCVVGPEKHPVAGGEISLIHKDKVLLLCSAPWDGHFMREFQAGRFSRRSIIALSSKSGELLWSGRKGYRSRPLVAGDAIYAEPWAYDLRTGKPRMRSHPLTRQREKWEMWRGYGGCGGMAASANTLFFRAGTIGYYDLIGDQGVLHLGGLRPGCWINFIPANGIVLIPEGSAQCVCPYAIQCSVALYHKKNNRAWGLYTFRKPLTPVKHIALNLGAPGDRRDNQGTLWLHCPNRVHRWHWVSSSFLRAPDAGYYSNERDVLGIEGTDKPWVFACGGRGLRHLAIPMINKGQKPAVYSVRLSFAEPEDLKPGERIFNVSLQGKEVLKDFDIAKEAGGPKRAIVKEFKSIEVSDRLTIELTPSERAEVRLPVLCGLEAIDETHRSSKPTRRKRMNRKVRVGTAQPRPRLIDYRIRKPADVLARVDSSLGELEKLIHKAGATGCDVLTLPEDTLGLGHWEAGNPKSLRQVLPAAVDRMLKRLGRAAASHNIYLVCCNDTVEPDGSVRNTAFLLGRDGREIGRYHKVNMPIHELHKKRGDRFPVFHTPDLGEVGMLICYDMVFPEAARCLALGGADIIFHPTLGGAAIGDSEISRAAFRTRAVENFVYIVVSQRGSGSMIISPKGEILVEAKGHDDIAIADIDPFAGREGGDAMNHQRDMRARLFRERCPAAYGILSEPKPPVLDKVPETMSIEDAVRIANAALTVGEKEFQQADALVRDGKAEEAIRAFEALIARYPKTWIDRVARERLATLRAEK